MLEMHNPVRRPSGLHAGVLRALAAELQDHTVRLLAPLLGYVLDRARTRRVLSQGAVSFPFRVFSQAARHDAFASDPAPMLTQFAGGPGHSRFGMYFAGYLSRPG